MRRIVGIVLPPFTFISERQRIFITFFVPPHFDNNLQHDKCFVIENNVWWLFISFTFYNSTVFRVVLIFVECTLTLEGSRKIKSEFPDESKQSPQSSTFCSLSINGVKPLSNDFHIVYWIFSPQKTKCLPAGVIVILEVIKEKKA